MSDERETNEERRMRQAAIAWARPRWPGCRVIHELVLGERRIDLVFVAERDMAGMEIKSSVDTLDRLEPQMKEYSRYLPELWLAVAPRWQDHEQVGHYPNVLIVDPPRVTERMRGRKPARDELVCSRLLELLWYSEACAIAVRADVIPLRVPKQIRRHQVLKLLSRLLTGNEIIAEVCRELRARELVGQGSDAPIRHLDVKNPQRLQRIARPMSQLG